MPRVSILLPTHNRADVLELAIQSVLDQTETDFELLVVADGCTDGTAPLVAGLGDPRIRLFDLPKAPFFGYANRNVALREARGEYVAFAAHDDLLVPDHLRLLIDRLDETGRDWAYSRPLWVSTDGTIVPFATNLTIADELHHFLTVANTIPASCVVYRRTCLDRYGYWPEDVPSAADWRHWIAIIEGGRRENIAYLATPTCLHFSADWKRSRHSASADVRAWLDIADGCAWWPDVLRYAVPPGVPEQRVIARAMQAGGSAWVADVRAAVGVVLSRVAWDDLRTVRPLLRSRELELERLRTQVGGLEQSLTDASQTIDHLSDQAAARDAECQALQQSVTDSRQTINNLSARAGTLDAECQTLQQALNDALQTVTHLSAHARTLDDEHQVLLQSLAAAEANAAEYQAAHEATRLESARIQTELEAARAQLRAAHERLTLTLASTSWRITAPMRALKQQLTPRPRTSR